MPRVALSLNWASAGEVRREAALRQQAFSLLTLQSCYLLLFHASTPLYFQLHPTFDGFLFILVLVQCISIFCHWIVLWSHVKTVLLSTCTDSSVSLFLITPYLFQSIFWIVFQHLSTSRINIHRPLFYIIVALFRCNIFYPEIYCKVIPTI